MQRPERRVFRRQNRGAGNELGVFEEVRKLSPEGWAQERRLYAPITEWVQVELKGLLIGFGEVQTR